MTPSEEYVFKQDYVKKFDFVEVEYYTSPEKKHQTGINKANGFDALVYLKMLLNDKLPYKEFFLNEVILRTLKYSLKKITDSNSRIAILAKTNEAGEIIGEFIKKHYPDLTIGYYNSKITNIHERQLQLSNNIIISTDKSFSGIINIERLEVIINCTPITSEAHILQIAGRLRKEDNKKRIFIQLADFSFAKARGMMVRLRKIMEKVSLSMNSFQVNKPNKQVITEE
jgi:hypothetical protein